MRKKIKKIYLGLEMCHVSSPPSPCCCCWCVGVRWPMVLVCAFVGLGCRGAGCVGGNGGGGGAVATSSADLGRYINL